MGTITYSTLHNILNITISDITAAKTEAIIDHAVNKINRASKGTLELPNMTGTAGSKTLSVTSAEEGGIIEVAVAVYRNIYRGDSQANAGPVSIVPVKVEDVARDVARSLKEIEVSYG